MEKNIDKKNMKSKNETEELKKEENYLRAATAELTEQNIIQDIQKNDITISLRKDEIKKPHYWGKGNLYLFCYDKNGVPRIVIGPHCKN